MLRTLTLRIRQLTLAALLVATTIPALASTAAAETCFNVQFSGALPGFGTSATITTQECGTIPGTTAGTFIVTVGGYPIASGELTANHTATSVTAQFEGEMTIGQEFNGSLTYNAGPGQPGSGWTTVHFEDVGTVTVTFHCTPTGLFSYSCSIP